MFSSSTKWLSLVQYQLHMLYGDIALLSSWQALPSLQIHCKRTAGQSTPVMSRCKSDTLHEACYSIYILLHFLSFFAYYFIFTAILRHTEYVLKCSLGTKTFAHPKNNETAYD